jgi:hypothetical protein
VLSVPAYAMPLQRLKLWFLTIGLACSAPSLAEPAATPNHRTKRFSCFRRTTLRWEIAVVILIKLAMLTLIWTLCFSTPQANHMQVPQQQVTQHLLSTALPNPSFPQPAQKNPS